MKELFHRPATPVFAEVDLTGLCPLKCEHCLNWWRHGIGGVSHMNDETAQIVINELLKAQIMHLTLTGGEPLENKPILYKFLEELYRRAPQEIPFGKKLPISINTTLIGMTMEDIELFKKFNVKSILTSLHSHDKAFHDEYVKMPGAWEKTMQGIRLLMKHGIAVGVNMVVTKKNFDHIELLSRYIREMGIDSFFLTKTCIPSGLSKEEFENFKTNLLLTQDEALQLLHSIEALNAPNFSVKTLISYPMCISTNPFQFTTVNESCGAGLISCAIGVDGEIRLCSPNAKVYGNVADGIKNVWSEMGDFTSMDAFSKKCGSCEMVSQCIGGCKVNEEYFGRMDPFAQPKNVEQIKMPPPSNISLDMKLVIPEIKKIRTDVVNGEDVFLVAVLGTSNFGFLNEDTFVFLEKLKNKKSIFSPRYIMKIEDLSERETITLCGELKNYGFINIYNNEKNN